MPTYNELFDAILNAIGHEKEFVTRVWESFYEMPKNWKAARQRWIEQHDNPPLTDEEKRQAFLDYTLERKGQ